MIATNNIINSNKSLSVFYTESGYKPLPCIKDRDGIHPYYGFHKTILPMDKVIMVGFGLALLTKNNECLYMYDEMSAPAYANYMSVVQAEELAAADPNHDWRIHLIAPLSELHYQRQGKQNWILYEKGEGFA
ncbi:MAG: hypothetical protein KKC46_04730 [Proteobacteria bacterium]|nr:hypothetical protein [Pseudomonadota bacterium]